jgi:flagellar motor protein MotB
VFIEGHSDRDPLAPGGAFTDNWDLSTARALATYRELMAAEPALSGQNARPLFSVAGYGPDRPIAPGDSEQDKARNRRIDLRVVMATPAS